MRRSLVLCLLVLAAFPAAAAAQAQAITAGTAVIDAAAVERTIGMVRHSERSALAVRGAKPANARDAAVRFLVEQVWMEGEAALRGVVVSDAEVRGELAFTREQLGFASRRAYERWLWRELRMRPADIERRTRQEMLFRPILEQWRVQFGDDRAHRSGFAELHRRWRAVTTCRRPYVVAALCGQVTG